MKNIELSNYLEIFSVKRLVKTFKIKEKKEIVYMVFITVLFAFYLFGRFSSSFKEELQQNTQLMNSLGKELAYNQTSSFQDTIVLQKERRKLIGEIEKRIVAYLYQIPDYSYVVELRPYLEHTPRLLNEIPSAVPLEKGNYKLSSSYGYRKHPISGKAKKHYGYDFAASKDKPVYATASGTVLKVIRSDTGYGTHLIIKHRFGFQTLYGHLNKTLIQEGQKIEQHELIATVGTTGSSTGFHLHYEIRKSGIAINPQLSLNLKKEVYRTILTKDTIPVTN